jgi:hypothetical protein
VCSQCGAWPGPPLLAARQSSGPTSWPVHRGGLLAQRRPGLPRHRWPSPDSPTEGSLTWPDLTVGERPSAGASLTRWLACVAFRRCDPASQRCCGPTWPGGPAWMAWPTPLAAQEGSVTGVAWCLARLVAYSLA